MNKTTLFSFRAGACVAVLSLALLTSVGCRTASAPKPAVAVAPQKPEAPQPGPLKSLVQVNVTAQPALFLQPWNKSVVQYRRGLGALLPNHRILVTALLVSDANFVDLQQPPQGRRIAARVVARDYVCNLALLEPVTDPGDFFKDMAPFELDDAAKTDNKVSYWQVDDDGTPIITDGRISKVDIGGYPPGGRGLLTYRFQGSVEPRGGVLFIPAVRKGKLTGLLLPSGNGKVPTSIIPAPIIRRFLADVDAGETRAFPTLGITTDRTTDPAFRHYLHLPESVGGVYVSHVIQDSPAAKAGILEGDVLLSLDGFAINARKYYRDPDFGLLEFSHVVSGRKLAGDTISAEIWRKDATLKMDVTLSRTNAEELFIPPYLFDQRPSYVICGGLVFVELSRPYLQSFREESAAPILFRYMNAYPQDYSDGRKSMVILAYIIPTPVNVGYEQIGQTPVEEVNGKAIGSIRDLYEALKTPVNGLHAIRVHGSWPMIYLDAMATENVNRRIEASGLSPLFRIP